MLNENQEIPNPTPRNIVKETVIGDYKITKDEDGGIVLESDMGVNTVEYNTKYEDIYMILDMFLSIYSNEKGGDSNGPE